MNPDRIRIPNGEGERVDCQRPVWSPERKPVADV